MGGTRPSKSCATESEIRRGPWTPEEDTLLTRYISNNGEGHWNMLAKRAGLKRIGKSCRLRWLNYLKPGIKHGNLTLQEHLTILHLHSKLGNRWSKIAEYLPGRTDNEIKSYWRTRVHKQARKMNTESHSKRFIIDGVEQFWIPTLLQKMEQDSNSSSSSSSSSSPKENNINLALFPNTKLNTKNFISVTSPIISQQAQVHENPDSTISSAYNNRTMNDCYYVDSFSYETGSLNMVPGSDMGSLYTLPSECQVPNGNSTSGTAMVDTFWNNMDNTWPFGELESKGI